jgi:Icc-related predicted phosphoesterase
MIEIPNNGADLLILSGDITVASQLEGSEGHWHLVGRTQQFFEQVCKDFKNVVYVLGNHEHYHGNFVYSADILRNELDHYANLHILDIGSVVIDDVVFVGGTLWTNFNRNDPVVKWNAQSMMNDYRGVLNGTPGMYGTTPKFLPDDAIVYHEAMLKYIEEKYVDETWSDQKPRSIVVVGHHAPSMQSISGRYVNDALNGAYASDLSEFILDHPKIKLWTHGHIHTSSDYMIGTTRIVANPRGYYGYEENPEFDSGKLIEV